MISHSTQHQILNQLSIGLDICEHPYQKLALDLGVNEKELLSFINDMVEQNVIKRMGMVVNHHRVGYRANAMVVWDIPDDKVDQIGELFAKQKKITLCYQRPRQLPDWPYNLFIMIHGKCRTEVKEYLESLTASHCLDKYRKDILFSSQKYKQTGAKYIA
ncbi:siroheme decarboxylase subunit beta [Aliikangiella sp. IMCC44359]|uniref:siroheme decarboxylase subunit beta n=1 Tax=Aliikangiella sp. IMCC44359 TaxID=3459125 RepID=UPI00403A804A